MLNPQMTSSQMELLPLVCLCLLSWSGTTSADQPERVVVKQDDDVILPCSIKDKDIRSVLFDWKKDGQKRKEVFLYDKGDAYGKGRDGQDVQYIGRVSHFEDELKHGNASIKIRNAKLDDSGDYTCKFPNLEGSPTFHIEFVVDRVLKDRTGENIPGAAPEPSVTILRQTKNSALLQCKAHGVPDLEVHWQDRDGNNLTAEKSQVTERGGLSYITLNTTVTKTDYFRCVATQKNFGHRISAEIHVYIDEREVVEQGSDVILPCSPNFNTESETFHWKKDGQKEVFKFEAGQQSDDQTEQFKGRVSHFQHELKHGNASIKITNTKVDDSGDYTCVFPNLQPSPTFNVKLVVVGSSSRSESVSPMDGLLLLQFFFLFLLF